MKKNGTYADHVIIKALAKHLKCAIKIVQADGPDININNNAAATAVLVVGYLQELKHYTKLKKGKPSGNKA